MATKHSHEELEQMVKELQKESLQRKLAEVELWETTRRLEVAYDQAISYAQRLNDEIAERRRAEEGLRQSEERYRGMFENSTDFVYTLDLEGNFTDVNKAAEHFTGYTRAELIGMNNRDYTPSEAQKGIFQAFNRIFETGEPLQDFSLEVTVKDGSKKYFDTSASLLRKGDGIIGFQGSSRDITDRKRVQEALQESEKRYRMLIETMKDGLGVLDENGAITYANDQLCEMTGYSKEEILGRSVPDFLDPDYLKIWEEQPTRRQLLEGEQYELGMVRRDGQTIYTLVSPKAILDSDGNFEGSFAVITDITEQKRAEEALRASERDYRGIIENMIDVYYRADLEGNVILFSPSGIGLTGYNSEEELIGKNLANDLYYHAEDRDVFVEELKKHGKLTNYEITLKRKDGTPVVGETSSHFVYDDAGQPVAVEGIFRDITERKRAEKNLVKERDKAQRYLDIAGVMIIALDNEGKVTLINKKGCEVLGYREEEIVGKNWFDNFLPKRLRNEVKAVSRKLMAGDVQPVEYFENSVLTKNGEERIMAWYNSILSDEEGNIIGHLSSGNDITERKLAEEALRESEEKYKTLTESSLTGIFIHQDGKYVFINDIFAEIHGYEPEELLGEDPLKLIYPDEREAFAEIAAKRLRGEDVPQQYEVRRLTKDGKVIWCEMIATSVEYDGRPAIMGNIIDITERKASEEALRKSEEGFRGLFEQSNDSVFIHTLEGKILDVNSRACQMLGYERERLLGLSIPELHPEDSLHDSEEVLQGTKDTGSVLFESTFKKADGNIIDVEISSRVVDPKEGIVQGIVRDITERKRAEEKIFRKTAVVEAINKVFQETLVCETEEEVAYVCINMAEELTGSKYGLIGEINEAGRFDTITYGDLGWAICKMPESDAIALSKDMEIRGIWGQAILKGKSQIVNDPASHPNRVGVPESHPQISSFLGVPLKHADRTLGVIGLANKEGGYEPADQEAVESLSVAFVEALYRKRAEVALKESEEKFRTLAEESPNMIFINKRGRIVYANVRCIEVMGYKRDQFYSSNFDFFTLISPEDTELARSNYAKHMKGEEVLPCEYGLITQDGKRMEVMLSTKLIDYEGERAILGIINDITEHKRAEQALKESESQLRALGSRLAEVEEVERKELARELHDRVGQNLTALGINLNIVNNSLQDEVREKVGARLDDALQQVEETAKVIRDVMAELRPPVLDDYGLIAALRWYCKQLSERTGIAIVVQGEELKSRLSMAFETGLFRVAQEALTNVAKHARANQVAVTVDRVAKGVRLVIADDGQEFDPESVGWSAEDPKWGLLTMRERAAAVGGTLHIKSDPGMGTEIVVEVKG